MTSIGETLRDGGIEQVADNNRRWINNALQLLETSIPEGEFMAEEFKNIEGIGKPQHPNAWGALTRIALKRGLIESTGKFRKATSATNHAHQYQVYTRAQG